MNQPTSSIPLISVIIPCHNSAEYISETLDSLLASSWKNFEVLAIDDASSDNTVDILRSYQQRDNRIHIIEQQQNTYCVIARQNAIAHAKGEYLVCLDSDDKLAPTYLEKCVSAAEQDKSLSIVYTDGMLFGRKNGPWKIPEFAPRQFLMHCSIYVSALIRKSDFDAVGGFDTSLTLCEDWELFISIIKNGGKVHRIHEPLFFYRQRLDHSSASDIGYQFKERLSDNIFHIYSKHYDFYKQHHIYFSDIWDCQNKIVKMYKRYYLYSLRRFFYQWFKPKKYQEIIQIVKGGGV